MPPATPPDSTAAGPAAADHAASAAAGGRAADDATAREEYLLIDVRTPAEFAQMRVPGSINIPLDRLDQEIGQVVPDLAQPLVLFCKSGMRSAQACQYLARLGYTDLSNGGTVEWVAGQLGVAIET